MREYTQIGLQYSIESPSIVDKIKERGEEEEDERNVHSFPIKKIKYKENEEKERRGEERK